jgi:MFS family permease
VLALSLGWSIGSLLLGQIVDRIGTRNASIAGAVFLTASCGLTLTFSTATSLSTCFWVFLFVGTGMGFVALGTILVVQNSLSDLDLGVATASNQFSRTLGGTIGVGVGGGFFSLRFDDEFDAILKSVSSSDWPAAVASQVQRNPENLFRPEVQVLLSTDMLQKLHEAVARSVMAVFWMVLAASILCLVVCCLLPKLPAAQKTAPHPKRS